MILNLERNIIKVLNVKNAKKYEPEAVQYILFDNLSKYPKSLLGI